MKSLLFAFMVAATAACGSRKVEVSTGPTPTSDVALHVTNNISQAVNVYVVSGGTDMFVAQVPANSTQHLPVSGVAAGATVQLKARTADGTRTYTKDNVAVSSMTMWTLP